MFTVHIQVQRRLPLIWAVLNRFVTLFKFSSIFMVTKCNADYLDPG